MNDPTVDHPEDIKKLGEIIGRKFNQEQSDAGSLAGAPERALGKNDAKKLKQIIRGAHKGVRRHSPKKLKENLEKIEAKRKELARSITIIEGDIKNRSKELEQKRRQVKDAENTLQDADRRIQEIKTKQPSLKKQVEGLQRQKAQREDEVKRLDDEVKVIRGEYEKVAAGLINVKDVLLQMKKDVDSFPDDMRETEFKIKADGEELAVKRGRISEVAGELDEAREKLRTGTQKMDELQKRLAESSSRTMVVEELYTIYEKTDAIPSEIEASKRRLNDIFNALSKKEAEVKRFKGERDALSKRVAELEKRRDGRLRELQARPAMPTKIEVVTEGKWGAGNDKSLQEMQGRLDEANDRLLQVRGEKDDANSKLRRLMERQAEIKTLQGEIERERRRIADELKFITGREKKEDQMLVIPPKLDEEERKIELDINPLKARILELEKTERDLEEEISKAANGPKDAGKKRGVPGRVKESTPSMADGGKDNKITKLGEELDGTRLKLEETEKLLKALEEGAQKIRDSSIKEEGYARGKHEELKLVKNKRVMHWTRDLFLRDLMYPIKEVYDSLTDEKSKLKARLDDMKTRDGKISQELNDTEKTVKETREEINSLEDEQAETNARIETLEDEVAEMKDKKGKFASEIEGFAERTPSIEREMAELTKKEEDLALKLDRAIKTKKELDEAVRNLEKEAADISDNTESYAKELEKGVLITQKSDQDKTAISKEINDAEQTLLKMVLEKNAKQDELDGLTKEAAVIELRLDIASKFR